MNELTELTVLPWLWITPVAVAIVTALGFLWWFGLAEWFPGEYSRKYPRERFPWSGWSIVAIIWWVIAGMGLVAWLLLLMPYDSKYHVLYNLEGEVANVTRSFTDGSGDLTYSPVVTLKDVDTPFVVNDSRIYDYIGQDVRFTCSIEWVPYGQDRLGCFIAGTTS